MTKYRPRIVECRIIATVYRDGYGCDVEIAAHLDTARDLYTQALAEIIDWVSRQQRVHGLRYERGPIMAINRVTPTGIWRSDDEWHPSERLPADN